MKFLSLLGALVLSSTVFAQDCKNTLSGYIIDLHDNKVLENASIIIVGSEKLYTTDKEGKYSIPNLCEATYTLQVSHEACATQLIRLSVKGNTQRNINMEHHLEALGEVSIEGKSNLRNTKTAVELSLDKEDIQANSGAALGDALKQLSGVSSLNTGNTVVKPVIQGLHSSRVVLITDGTRLQDQEWGVEHAPNVDINAAGSVQVIKGASALQYGGDAVGGTIIIKPAKIPFKDSIYGYTIITAADNGRGGTVTSSLTKSFNSGWYANLQGTIKRFGDFESPDYVLSNTGAFERDFAGRIGHNTFSYGIEASYSSFRTDLGILRASHVGSAGDLAIAINSDRPSVIRDFTYEIDAPRQEIKHQIAKISGFKRFEEIGKLTFQYDYQQNNRLEFDIRRDSDDLRPSIDLQLGTHSFTTDFVYNKNPDFIVKTGILGRRQVNFPDPKTGVRRLIPDYEKFDAGVYGIVIKKMDPWTFEGGLRYDYQYIDAEKFYRTSFWEARGYDVEFADLVVEDFGTQLLVRPQFNFHNISATLGVNYEFNDTYSIAANYALANRAPNPSELFSDGLHQSAARIELGDIRFDKETSSKVAVTLSRKQNNWDLNLAPFVNSISDFLLIEPTGSQQTLRGNFPVWEYRQTNALLYGVDIDNRVTLAENWEMSNQLSVVKGKDRTRDLPLINIPPVNTRNKITFSKPKWKNLKLSLESFYSFEQTDFPNTNFDVFIPELNTDVTVDVSTPPAAYHLLNFSGQVDFKLGNSKLQTVLAVNNLANTLYRDYLNRQRYFADDIGRNVLLQLKFNY